MQPKVSLFASSIRPRLWGDFFKSLKGTSVDIEVVFAGNPKTDYEFGIEIPVKFKYIKTANIKPAQCYEIARRACTGELICWVADDCEFPFDVIGRSYNFFKENCSRRDILAIQTRENYGKWTRCNMSLHSFFGGNPKSPRMCPLGMMDRKYLEEIGGIDRRYICGQYENDIAMRVYQAGGGYHLFKDAAVNIDHFGKHKEGELTVDFKRTFALGYITDRKILESSWSKNGVVLRNQQRYDSLEKFKDTDILTKSQSNNLSEIWE